MPIELIAYLVLCIVGGGLQVCFTWGLNQWPARWVPLIPWLLVLVLMLLGGCATREPSPPAPPPAPIVCAAPAGMTGPDPEPERPQGDYTQRDVALYVSDLQGWGRQGWKRLAAVRRHASQCIDEHTDEPRE